MNKLIPFTKFAKTRSKQSFLSNTSVIVDSQNTPLGFVFGRDSFISLCTVIDDEFEKKVTDPKRAYDNPAGRLIDLIEEKLPVSPKFAKELKSSISQAKKTGWVSFDKLARALNV